MIEIYRAAHPAQAHLLRGLLEAEGIEASVIGEFGFNVLFPYRVVKHLDQTFATFSSTISQHSCGWQTSRLSKYIRSSIEPPSLIVPLLSSLIVIRAKARTSSTPHESR